MKNLINKIILTSLIGVGSFNSYSQNSRLSENSRVLIYGESNHDSFLSKKYVINSADSLKKEGYNYFAIELPIEYNSLIQSFLKDDETSQSPIVNRFIEWYSSFERMNLCLEMCWRFYKKGFEVILIDTTIDGELEALHLGDTFKIDNRRDPYMAKNIEKILEKDSSAKIVAYVGAFHATEAESFSCLAREGILFWKYPPMAGILKRKGINPETIYLIEKADAMDQELKKYSDKTIYLK